MDIFTGCELALQPIQGGYVTIEVWSRPTRCAPTRQGKIVFEQGDEERGNIQGRVGAVELRRDDSGPSCSWSRDADVRHAGDPVPGGAHPPLDEAG